MLVEKKKINVNKYINKFNKSFTNFCKNAPISLEYTIVGKDYIKVIDSDSKKEIIQHFNFEKTIKENIYEIKVKLIQNMYPRVIKRTVIEEPLSQIEIEKLIDKGYSIGEASIQKKEIVTDIEYIITKVIVKQDRLFLQNTKNKEEKILTLNIPVVLFLKKLRENWNMYEAYNFLSNKIQSEKTLNEETK